MRTILRAPAAAQMPCTWTILTFHVHIVAMNRRTSALHRHMIAIFLILWGPLAAFGQTQARPSYLDRPAQVLLPDTYREDRAYPLIVYLPFTGSSAADFHRRLGQDTRLPEAIVILPAGTPVRDHYLPDFWSFILWYEERLLQDIEQVRSRYNVDSDAIVLAGFSLGGDLGWALGMRHPELFSGAVLAGTRTSYPANDAALSSLQSRRYRAALIIGRQELRARYDGIRAARTTLDAAGVSHRFREVEGGHSWGSSEDFVRDLRWALGLTNQRPF